jgi:uncharacterized ParB-like nuclease family protein
MKFLATLLFALSTTAFASGTGMHEVQAPAEEVSNTTASEKQEALASAELCDEDLEVEEDVELFEKVGFLTVEDCALKGTFTSCYSEAYVCGFEGCFEENQAGEINPVQVVLFVHDEGKYYKVQLDGVKPYQLDEGIGRNTVTVIGQYDEATNTIYASDYKAPPPPTKSFFKGCL